MSSSKFSRRPRIQPLPPVCKKSPETTSCYDRPTEPPDPLHVAGSLEILSAGGARLYYSTFRIFGYRSTDYQWTLTTKDSEENDCEPELVWWRPSDLATFEVTFAIPVYGGQTFNWPNITLKDDFPWLRTFYQTIDVGDLHICSAQFYN